MRLSQPGKASRGPLALLLMVLLTAGAATAAVPFSNCGPFTDVGTLICPFVLELYYSGITAGTSATTFSPNEQVTRGQMAVFTSTALDLSLARSSRPSALGQWWTSSPDYGSGLGVTPVGQLPQQVVSDGSDLWVTNMGDSTVSRVRGSDGKLIETWSCPEASAAILVAMGRVFVAGTSSAAPLAMIDPSQPAGMAVSVAQNIGNGAVAMTFDGSRIWIANDSGSIAIVTPGPSLPWNVTTITNSDFAQLSGILFDGANVWLTSSPAALFKLDVGGNVIQTVGLNGYPQGPTFDGRNLWVPIGDAVEVVRASNGAILATLTSNGLHGTQSASFDGQRVLVADSLTLGMRVSLFRAADLAPLGTFYGGDGEGHWVCSDGVNFWITVPNNGHLDRF